MKDQLPHRSFRAGNTSWKDFLKSFSKVIQQKTILSPLTPEDLADLFAMVEKDSLRVETVLMNAITYSDVRKWGSNIIDIRILREELIKGWMASIWGAYIIVNKKVPDGIVLAISEDKRICAKLELGQEKYYNLDGINALKNEATELNRRLNNVYSKMGNLIDRAFTSLKKR